MKILSKEDGSWQEMVASWTEECRIHDEDFENFADGIFSVIAGLADVPEKQAAIVGVEQEGSIVAICQINTKLIKGYSEPVLRVRHILLSPRYDLTDVPIAEYARVIVATFYAVKEVSNVGGKLAAKHIKFHLRSAYDQQFFAALGDGLRGYDEFASVQSKGAWLYVTKA